MDVYVPCTRVPTSIFRRFYSCFCFSRLANGFFLWSLKCLLVNSSDPTRCGRCLCECSSILNSLCIGNISDTGWWSIRWLWGGSTLKWGKRKGLTGKPSFGKAPSKSLIYRSALDHQNNNLHKSWRPILRTFVNSRSIFYAKRRIIGISLSCVGGEGTYLDFISIVPFRKNLSWLNSINLAIPLLFTPDSHNVISEWKSDLRSQIRLRPSHVNHPVSKCTQMYLLHRQEVHIKENAKLCTFEMVQCALYNVVTQSDEYGGESPNAVSGNGILRYIQCCSEHFPR